MATWAELLTGKTQAQIFASILARLKALTIPFPVDDWDEGAVVRTTLDTGYSGALAAVWEAIPDIVKGGFLRLAQGLAEADLESWTADPTGHWLYLLGTQLFFLPLKAAAFTEGTIRFVNSSGTPRTIDSSHVVTNTAGLRYFPTETKALAAGATVYVKVKAEQAGGAYNVAQSTVTILSTSLPGVTVSNDIDPSIPGQMSWILTYGSDTEAPKAYADRCQVRWGRLTKLQALPRDGYRSLALDAHTDVKRVAVWSNYNHNTGTFEANTVTMYLGSDTGPVAAAVATTVRTAMLPYIGLHDKLMVQPCGTATWTLTGTVYVSDAGLIPQVKAAVEAAILAYQRALDIGETGIAWEIRARVKVPGVRKFADTMIDYVPPKNALISIQPAALAYQVL